MRRPWLITLALCGACAAPSDDIAGGKTDTLRSGVEDVGQPWGSVPGILQFRGNPTNTFYGTGPVSDAPAIQWKYPEQAMCGQSKVGGRSKTWCGTGWTGQPVIWERPDGITEAIFGAYDKSVHFVDVATGQATRPPFKTKDIIKGSVTLDPDGFPLIYFGSRDNKLRAVALDRDVPTELWALDAHVVPIMWNNDWDGNPSIVDGILYEGGENSHFFAVELNREFAADGKVQMDPEILVAMPGWTEELIQKVGDNTASIENSVAVFEDRVYFANGHGRVVGLDTSNIRDGEAPVVFDFWAGDDIDASIVVDAEGMLYVAIEHERGLPRADEVGQLIKLDPSQPENPLVWSVHVPAVGDDDGGFWATPALGNGFLYIASHAGELLTVRTTNGEVASRIPVGWHAWSSPVLVGDRLVLGRCSPGGLLVFSIELPHQPQLVSSLDMPSCIESTPAIWNGDIVVGSRDGFVYKFR